MKNYYDKHKLLYKFLVKFVAPLAVKIFVKKINNLELNNYPKAFIIASNHTSFLDPFILSSIFVINSKRKVYFIGKKQLLQTLPSKIFHEAVGTIPIYSKDKGESALKKAKKYLKTGKIVGIFPEGARSPDGKLKKAYTGIARLALMAKVPVLPTAIQGTFNLMPIGRIIPKFRKEVIINIGKMMYFTQYYNKKINKMVLRKITNNVMMRIERLMVK